MRVQQPSKVSLTPSTSISKNNRLSALRAAGVGSLLLTSVSVVGVGCLDRPVAPATPEVSARVLVGDKQSKVSKIDLLFMIDNSSSMADKQTILGQAVPDLVKRLIEPKCVDKDGRVVGDAVGNQCTTGTLDFEPIKDIHIGIVSSSLGAHGAGGQICDDASDSRTNAHNNDRGHLISRNATGSNEPTFGSKGFLTYNPNTAGALQNVGQVVTPFRSMVEGVGQHGCGYEASLESVYRFLIDPEPYEKITIDTSIGGMGQAVRTGIDTQLLAQRAEFLRPDSLVSIMMVTDENDCSIVDEGQGFYPLVSRDGSSGSVVARGTSACLTNPNDRCCFNCNVSNAPTGCTLPADDSECKKPPTTGAEDALNLRCFNQKQRYGMSFLYPVERYIEGFSKATIHNRKGEVVQNPLFADLNCKAGTDCQSVRSESLVFVAGITGVPWQLISKNPNDLLAGYKSAKEIQAENLWLDLVGDQNNPSGPIAPKDPHMVESIAPRAALAGPASSASADPIHGHDWDTSKIDNQANSDLQYACTFALPTPKTCTSPQDCDCGGSPTELNGTKNPLCQNGTSFTTTQTRAKAYPGTRVLQVLQGLDPDQAIVASICPANLDMKKVDAPDYGYTPAIQALISRLRTVLRGRCLPRPLEVDTEGQVPCVVVEASKSKGTCDCSLPGRAAITDDSLITQDMRDAGNCFCELQQIKDEQASELCKTSADPGAAAGNGWCYVDPSQGKDGKPDTRQCGLVSKCGATERRLIKYVNTSSEPRSEATAFILCQEKAYDPKAAQQDADVCK
jgi:hypothetical protein